MINKYTEEAKQRCLSLVDNDIENIWESIEQMPTDTDADKWKKKLTSIANEYTYSCRFALMRIFLDRADTSQLIDKTDPSRGFTFVLSDGTECTLDNITIEHAEQCSDKDVTQFERLLLEQAYRQSDFDALKDALIIRKALSPVQKKTTLLTREEAFHLGHILLFTIDEMQWFLLRVFDVEDGFCYNTSNDLIEAYGFLTEASCQAVSKLKEKFKLNSAGKEKADFEEKENNWTKDIGGSLQEKVREWSVHDRDDRDSLFLKWLDERAPFLDISSKTAVCIYRNLAVFAYNLAIQVEDVPDVDSRASRIDGKNEETTDFVHCMEEIIEMREYDESTLEELFDNNTISPKKCERIANTLLLENWNFSLSDQTDKTKAWHVIQVMTDGHMTVNGGVNESRTRVRDILSGKAERIEKSDMLYLLWFISNLCWFDGKSKLTAKDVTRRLSEFIEVSEVCLDTAGLPKFYPPHLVEQSMMLSVVYAFSEPEKCDPAEIYEQICSAIPSTRNRKADGEKNPSYNRIASLRRKLKLNQTQLAEKLGVTQTTVSAWETGKSEPSEEYQSLMADLFGTSVEFLMGRVE